MANRYWVGGTGNWNPTNTANWSTSSGGSGGASVPTSSDSVFFDQAGTYTVTIDDVVSCLDFTISAGTVTIADGTTASEIDIFGSMYLSAATVWNFTYSVVFSATTTGKTITTNGVYVTYVVFSGIGGGWALNGAFSGSTLTVSQGTFSTANYNLSLSAFFSGTLTSRSINFGSSTIVVTASFSINSTSGLTFNAGTSSITQNSNATFAGAGQTFYNVTFGSTSTTGTCAVSGTNTFNNLTIIGLTNIGVKNVTFSANQTINGVLTLSAGTGSVYRTFIQSDSIGTTRTLNINSFAVGSTDIDFRDITISGAAAPLTGVRFGDAKGNSGITFPAAKTVYWRATAAAQWAVAGAGSWSLTSGGAADAAAYPLAQDTAVFPAATYPASGSIVTITSNTANIGTIDMSLRTTNTMTLTVGSSLAIYGNWVNGTGVTPSGTGTLIFAGQGSQTITSAGRTFTQAITVNTPGGTVALADAFITNRSAVTAVSLIGGTFDLASYTATLSGATSGFTASSVTASKILATGTGTLVIAGTGGWIGADGATLAFTGTGTISLTSASTKTFAGADNQGYPTLNQGGAGQLSVTGSNKFANITNTYSATGATSVLFTAGTSNEFTAFNLTGTVGKVCTLGSLTAGQAILRKLNTWYMGANSTDAGNNTNLVFSAGGGINYLSVSYIDGEGIISPSNFFMLF